MQTNKQYIRDQLAFAKQGAENLAKRNGYQRIEWLKAPNGKCSAAFDRDGERWSLSFTWTDKEELGALAERIEKMDFYMRLSMKEFGALKTGALMRQIGEGTMQ